jgi:predicted DNA binding CopG/RHH family protein
MTATTVPSVPAADWNPTPRRTVRIPDEVWQAAQAKAAERGDNLSEVIREALVKYAARD